eukprot:4517162-Pyramimonas_sp.AAC.1
MAASTKLTMACSVAKPAANNTTLSSQIAWLKQRSGEPSSQGKTEPMPNDSQCFSPPTPI